MAIKVLRPDSAPGKFAEEMRARFLAEAEALRNVSHPHVVRVFEIVEARLWGATTLGFVMGSPQPVRMAFWSQSSSRECT